MAHIAIAGAGLAGRLFAWALARAGHQVSVFDAGPGPEPRFDGQGAAAFTAAGMLSPLAEQEAGGADVAALGWQSLALWPGIVAALPVPTRPALQLTGSLLLAHGSDRGAAARALARMPGAQALTAPDLRAMEPALAPSLLGWLLPGEGLIHPVQAMAALQAAAEDVQWHWQQPVAAVEPGALTLSDGRRIAADWSVDTRALGARPDLPLRGVRGEVLTLEIPAHGLRRPVRLLHARHRVYLVPRSASELVVGASEIESEDRSPVSVRSAIELMAAAHSVLPQLSEARITRLDRNLRPALPDNLPHAQAEPGLLCLNGLYRHGWLLAPALVQRLLLESGLASLEIPECQP
ncbi:FAD-dependent oxidoreductase [Roseateles sp.]|uniref:FAD-dependent oxidoreductase n=1 Tax=Roseateles sp. TaxID=1971397 RepID=UPI0037C8FB37